MSTEIAEERRLIEQVLGEYDRKWRDFAVLPRWYGAHLRVKVEGEHGPGWQLRERPAHIPREAWCFHHRVQPSAPPLPTVPALVASRSGPPWVTVEGRDFELIGWLPGEPQGINTEADGTAAGAALGDLHAWLLSLRLPPGPDRLTSTTNDLVWWMRELRRDGHDLPALLAFCDHADRLLAELPNEPPVAVHGDVHPYNLVWVDGQVSGFCDWEDAHLNVPSFDLAYLLTHCTFVDWPRRLPSGREALVRPAVDQAKTLAILRAYRSHLGRPLPVTGFQRALVVAWVVTMRLTVLRGFVDDPCARQGQTILNWLECEANLEPWLEVLGG